MPHKTALTWTSRTTIDNKHLVRTCYSFLEEQSLTQRDGSLTSESTTRVTFTRRAEKSNTSTPTSRSWLLVAEDSWINSARMRLNSLTGVTKRIRLNKDGRPGLPRSQRAPGTFSQSSESATILSTQGNSWSTIKCWKKSEITRKNNESQIK